MAKSGSYTFDDSITVGMLVYCHYQTMICEVVSITPRFLTKVEEERTYDGKVGDEFNPLVTVRAVYNSQFKKVKGKALQGFDGRYVSRLTPELFDTLRKPHEEMVARINAAQKELNVLPTP